MNPGSAIRVEMQAGLAIVSLPAFNEINVGVLQGRYRDERDPEAQALWAQWQAALWDFRVPGGERFDEFTARVSAALQTILHRHDGQRVLIVGHGATNRVLLGTLLVLVSAFAGIEPIRRAYCHAIERRYRFYSYGDAMLVDKMLR